MEQKRVVALGFFDGVHLGHGALLQKCRQVANDLGATASVITFEPHPLTLITGKPLPLLNTVGDRQYLMQSMYGIDELMLCEFDDHLMKLPWEDFISDYLVGKFHATAVVCGHDYHFGYKGKGNAENLRETCAKLGLGCYVIDKVEMDSITISSTYIRSQVACGDMSTAVRFLGHPHLLTGTVVPGRQLGRTMGTPTANLLLPADLLPPAFGVYATKVTVESQTYLAVTNVGVRPTVHGEGYITVEPWLLDFDGDLYGKTLQVELYRHLRPEVKFPSLDALKTEILGNAQETRDFFESDL
ncbi:MAG: riboflavin biosynthesis protein RibF, partial [Eubacteriales bacterium]